LIDGRIGSVIALPQQEPVLFKKKNGIEISLMVSGVFDFDFRLSSFLKAECFQIKPESRQRRPSDSCASQSHMGSPF
jgi:hypothetical protein